MYVFILMYRGICGPTYCELLEDHVFPDIRLRMEFRKNKQSWYQEDGAGAHRNLHNQEVYDRIEPHGDHGSITVHKQPPQSPELMIPDLSINRSLDTKVHQIKYVCENIEQLIDRVDDVYWNDGDREGISVRAFLVPWGVLAEVYRKIMEHRGKSFKTPHSKVRTRLRRHEDVVDRSVNMHHYRACLAEIATYYAAHPEDVDAVAEPNLLEELFQAADLT
jgi:hypothetical protein